MSKKSMSLKSKIKNIAKNKNSKPQIILQNYTFERFLERLSNSKYKNKFILKGGILISAIVGVANRSTMDMDATIKNFPVNELVLENTIKEICNINLNDDFIFTFLDLESIREKDSYNGFRIKLKALYDNSISIPIHIDITTGDAITPKEILYLYKKIFDDDNISIWAYNIETILAEKIETVLSRGELNTRPRDFYDIYILSKTQEFNPALFKSALKMTSKHRNSNYIFQDFDEIINIIENSTSLNDRWIKYTKNYNYAKNISYSDIITAIKNLLN